MMHSLPRRLISECAGTAILIATVVGSGMTAERLSVGNSMALLGSAAATGVVLLTLIRLAGPISGAYFNPAITLVAALHRSLSWLAASLYMIAQIVGATAGVITLHWIAGLPLLGSTQGEPSSFALLVSEALATCGLVLAVRLASRHALRTAASVVAGYVATTFYLLPSSVANPAATVGRSLTDTFFGVSGSDMYPFLAMQLFGALVGLCLSAVPQISDPKAFICRQSDVTTTRHYRR